MLLLQTSSQALFNKAVDFYTSIVQLPIESKSASEALFGALRLVLSSDAPSQASAAPNTPTDWRSRRLAAVLRVSLLAALIDRCRANFVPHQIDEAEAYVLDPLGTVIGFTQQAHVLDPLVPVVTSAPSDEPLLLDLHGVALKYNYTNGRLVAVMTSGGDAPGMNAMVRLVVRTAILRGCKAYAIYEGYDGLVKGGDAIRHMLWLSVRGWLREGGTNIGTARCMEFRQREGRLRAASNLIHAGIDCLVVCGGDGLLTGADVFRGEWSLLVEELLSTNKITKEQAKRHQHLNLCGTVGSIDNDMLLTDATIGAYSSLARICQAIDYIDATAELHARAFVVEVMGRHCGWLALMAGIATSADYILIPEKPALSKEWREQMADIVLRHRERGKRRTMVLVAEGAITLDLQPISAKEVAQALKDLGLDTRVTTLGHVQRGGTAVAFDRVLATLQGVEAVNAVLECGPGTPSPMIGIEENKIVRRDLVEAVKLTKSVAEAIAAKDFKRAMLLREPDFGVHLQDFIAINSADHNEPSLSENERLRVAIINVGAPAGGMNSAVYSLATYCMLKGHEPYAIHNGFAGLAKYGSVQPIIWKEIMNWNSLGGSEIGTNRVTPREAGIGNIAYNLAKHKIEALILVGGFEAFVSLQQLAEERGAYPAFRIPMVLIPATISNNVPGTEYSLGLDTCLNALMEYCDIVKQSAAATRNRVFVVEIQGGNAGYIALYGQLISGANVLYVPEEGILLEQLESDIEMLKKLFEADKGKTKSGRLILKSANALKVLTTQVIADIINSESNGRFEARTSVPGHVQQGGTPLPIDRTRAAKFACRAVEFVEEAHKVMEPVQYDDEYLAKELGEQRLTAVVIGVRGGKVVFSPIKNLYTFEAEVGRRVPKTVFWGGIRKVAAELNAVLT